MQRAQRFRLLFAGLVLAGGLLALGVAAAVIGRRAPPGAVVSSVFPIHDLVRRIAGPDVPCVLLLPPGASAHTYQPRPTDAAAASQARILFVNGCEVDLWAERLAGGAAGPPVVRLGEGDQVRHAAGLGEAEHHDHEAGHADHEEAPFSHVWLDPVAAMEMTDRIATELARVDPDGAEGYRQRARRVRGSLELLHARLASERQSLRRDISLVTFHNAFDLLARRYHFTIAATLEPVPGRSPTLRDIERISAQVRPLGIRVLYTEPQLDSAPVRAVAEALGVDLLSVDPLGGPPTGADTYEGVIERIFRAFARSGPP